MLGVVFPDVLDSKVVDDEGESDGSSAVAEEAGSVGGSKVAVGGEVLGEAFVCEDACLRKAVHAFADFGQDVVVVDEGLQLVLSHDVRWDIFDGDPNILVARHWCAEVEIFDVDRHKLGVWSGEDAIDEDFDSGEVGSRRADVAFVDNAVASHGETDAFGFGFVWAEGGDDAEVSGNAVGWFVGVFDEKESVRPAVGVRMMSLGEASDFCCGAMYPLGGVSAAQELGILEGGAGCGIEDGVGVVEEPLVVGEVLGCGIGRRWGKGNNERCVEIDVCAREDAVGACGCCFGAGAGLMGICGCRGGCCGCRGIGSVVVVGGCMGGCGIGFGCALAPRV